MSCLGALFGFGWKPTPPIHSGEREDPSADLGESDMNEGAIHSGPGGYEGMGYSGGYAADFLDKDEDSDEVEEDNDDDDFNEDEANH